MNSSPSEKPSRRGMNNLRILALFVWAGLILYLSLTPDPPGSSSLPGWDKLLHAGAYGLMALLLAWTLDDSRQNRTRTCIIAFTLTMIFGASLEVLQGVMQVGRTAEWGDLVADGVGALLACVIFRHAGMFPWFRHPTKDGESG